MAESAAHGRAPWGRILLVYAAGLAAALALGKIGPAAPPIQAELGLTLDQVGWTVSAIAALAAALGLPVGLWCRRIGARNAVLLGLAILALAGPIAALADGPGTLIAGRLAEGIGYLLIVVAGAALLMRLSEGPSQAAALALWGTFIPVGLALGAALAGWLTPLLGWRGWLAAACLPPALLAAALAAFVPGGDAAPADDRHGRPRPGELAPSALLAAGFFAISAVGVAVLALLPSFLVERRGADLAAAGNATALASLASIAGSLLAAWLMGRGVGLRALSLAALVMPAAAWPVFATAMPPAATVPAAALVLVANGVVVSAMFGAVPRLIRHPDHAAVASGLVAQLGSLGSLVGPPLFGAVVAASGWQTLPAVALGLSVVGVVLLWRAARGAA
ncbi:MAG TPA: MFS transporter [Alphaproteobacteria bacterium]|nr:MFS transporter [Alphaproteobacteria bacterium]